MIHLICNDCPLTPLLKIGVFLQLWSVRPSVRTVISFRNFGRLELTYRPQILGIIPLVIRYLVKSKTTLY